MLAKIDPIAKIQQLYKDNREVPYLAFMQVFNDLLEDPAELLPRKPSPALREKFRAACMAVKVGIIDAQDRGEERAREFIDKIYPAWKESLPPEDFARYEKILNGRLPDGAEAGGPAADKLNGKSSALLKRLKLVGWEGPTEPPPPPPAGSVVSDLETHTPEFDTVDQVCRAIREGELKAAFAPRATKRELARYRLGVLEVGLSLVQGEGKKYAVLTAEIGYKDIPGADEGADQAASEMGYSRQQRHAYVRWDDELVYTLKVGPSKINVACSADEVGPVQNVVRWIQKAHMDLGEVIERLRAIQS